MFKSIKIKMMVIIGILILTIVAGNSLLTYNQSRDILQKTILNSAADSVKRDAKIVTEWLGSLKRQVLNFKSLKLTLGNTATSADNFNSSQLRDLYLLREESNLKEELEDDNLANLFISDLNGNCKLISDNETINKIDISDKEYFKKVKTTKEIVISKPFVNEEKDQVIAIVRPLLLNNEIKGVLGGEFKLDYLQELIKDMQISNNGHGWIVDSEMNTIAHINDKYLGNKEILNNGNQKLTKLMSQMVKGKTGTGKYTLNKKEKYLSFVPIGLTGWSIAITADSNQVLSPLL